MAFEDKDITCVDCGDQFTWTAGDQEFYRDKGLSAPKRCQPCRAKKRAEKEERSNRNRDNE